MVMMNNPETRQNQAGYHTGVWYGDVALGLIDGSGRLTTKDAAATLARPLLCGYAADTKQYGPV